MNNEQDSRGFRGQITQLIKEKGQIVASSTVIAGLGIAGAADAVNGDNSRDNLKDQEMTLFANDAYLWNADNYESLEERIAREAYENALLQETLMQENLEIDIEPTATPTPAPTLTPTPLPPAPTPKPYVPSVEQSSAYPQNSGKVLQEGESIWIVLADCETGDGSVGPPFSAQWDYNGPSGFDGGLQFHPDTWNKIGTGYDFAWQAPPDVQIAAAQKWLSMTSWNQWPGCYAEMRTAGYLE